MFYLIILMLVLNVRRPDKIAGVCEHVRKQHYFVLNFGACPDFNIGSDFLVLKTRKLLGFGAMPR